MKANGSAIRAIRELQGFTGAGFAREIDTDPSFLSKVELGTRPAGVKLLKRISVALRVPMAAITLPDHDDEAVAFVIAIPGGCPVCLCSCAKPCGCACCCRKSDAGGGIS